ncbi:MAG: aminotransferase class V-fold PLP-dependent enzyme [Phycisphaeraceae bacterium]|nr:aminotransferase class V-fold PLP-dependent enzyme [Phycisphaeraceae bacterium]
MPTTSPFARHWLLDPTLDHLNHGSFGACPIPVLHAQSRYRERMEAEAVRYFVQDFDSLMDNARRELAAFVNCPPGDLAFITNATVAVATALENEAAQGRLGPGDEVIASDHEYPACLNNLRRLCARIGAVPVMADIPFPIASPDHAVEAMVDRVTPRTRLALVSHVTSPSGLVLPIARIIRELESRGVRTIVDAAHAPGFTEVDLADLAPAYYAANAHKWLCSPKGSGMLYVRPDLQENFRPLVLSNSAEKPRPGRSRFLTEFDYIGTADHSAFLAVPDALAFMGTILEDPASSERSTTRARPTPDRIRAGFAELRRRNRELVLQGRDVICRALGVHPPAPDSMIGCLAAIFLPSHDPARHARLAARPSAYHDALQDAIINTHRIQVPIWSVPNRPGRLVRLSAQVYNSTDQYERLAAAIAHEIDIERTL